MAAAGIHGVRHRSRAVAGVELDPALHLCPVAASRLDGWLSFARAPTSSPARRCCRAPRASTATAAGRLICPPRSLTCCSCGGVCSAFEVVASELEGAVEVAGGKWRVGVGGAIAAGGFLKRNESPPLPTTLGEVDTKRCRSPSGGHATASRRRRGAQRRRIPMRTRRWTHGEAREPWQSVLPAPNKPAEPKPSAGGGAASSARDAYARLRREEEDQAEAASPSSRLPVDDSLPRLPRQLRSSRGPSSRTRSSSSGCSRAPCLQRCGGCTRALLVRGYSRSTVLAAQLVRAYARLGDAGLGHALCVFDGMPKRNSFAWNAVIKGLVDAGRFSEALGRYWDMASDGSVAADRFTYPPVLKSCAALGAVEQGRRVRENIEAEITRGDAVPNVFVQCALVDMFAKCRCLDEARSVFESMGVRDLAAWTAMIGGAVHGGDWFEVMDLFGRMRSEGVLPDSLIFATVIPACGRAKELRTGMTLQGCAVRCGVDDDICVRNALIDMYCKCDCLDVAASLFLSIRYKDVVSWSTIIVGHSQNGMYGSSVSLFTEMVSSGVKPNSTTLATILPSLLELKLSSHGKAIHCFSIRNGLDHSEFLVSAFIDFYSKQGLVGEAEIVFEFSPKKDLVIWNSMVGGYAVNEDSESALHALRALQKVGLRPDHVTIVSVLPLCNQHPRLLQGKELHAYAIRHNTSSVLLS
ncbi:hypothetical protein HU200_005191 [Digitaria exilis]|uniref:Pentatricopeptide repeat-containing protein n=1 Tax=Digitaria exilis TaxID=1010633 RepID=A0A835FSE3_9POAL|nr:hypothetical protein HU200_005191 [Digitaria exilis]